jgi:hypothetical protein
MENPAAVSLSHQTNLRLAMPVQIQSDMIVSKFWQDVKRYFEQELLTRKLASWTVVIRPHTHADDELSEDPKEFNLSSPAGRRVDHSAVLHHVDEAKLIAEFVIPDDEKLSLLGEKELLAAEEVAAEFAYDLEIALEE